jgi:hypothetical protein
MSEPCSEKETLTILQIRQAEIAGDIAHIKSRIDNGMSHTIADIHAKLTELKPVLEHHSNIVRRVEDFGWLISRWVVTGIITTAVALVLWAISKGFLIK